MLRVQVFVLRVTWRFTQTKAALSWSQIWDQSSCASSLLLLCLNPSNPPPPSSATHFFAKESSLSPLILFFIILAVDDVCLEKAWSAKKVIVNLILTVLLIMDFCRNTIEKKWTMLILWYSADSLPGASFPATLIGCVPTSTAKGRTTPTFTVKQEGSRKAISV